MKLTIEQEHKLKDMLDNIMKSSNEPRAKIKDLRNVLENLINYLEPRAKPSYTMAEKMKYIFKNFPEHRIVRKDAEGLRMEFNDIIHDNEFSYFVSSKDVDRLYQNLFSLARHFSNAAFFEIPKVEDKRKIINENFPITLYSKQIQEMHIDGKLLGQFVIMDLCALKFYDQHKIDFRTDQSYVLRLEYAAWKAVKEFCFKDTVRIELPYIFHIDNGDESKTPVHLDFELSYSDYEKMYKQVGGRLFPKLFRKWDKD